jgi:hypothetical protein
MMSQRKLHRSPRTIAKMSAKIAPVPMQVQEPGRSNAAAAEAEFPGGSARAQSFARAA